LDVAIVGGGPSGLVAGYNLAKDGFKVALFETNLHQVEVCGGEV